MSPERTLRVINSWETVRYELLNSRICDFGLRVEDSPVESYVHRLYRELEDKGLSFLPELRIRHPVAAADKRRPLRPQARAFE